MALLDGKVAIVTGAGRGIGRCEALALAEHGAAVVVNDLGGGLTGGGIDASPANDVVDEILSRGGQAIANHGDVSNFADAEALVTEAVDRWGRLDILVNNAGVIRTAMSFNMSEHDFDLVMGVHVKGTFATSRFAALHWRNQAKKTGAPCNAAIVNTSSPNGLNDGVPGHLNYAVAKSGIATMTVLLARELAPYGVRVNAVAPVAMTRMTEEMVETERFTPAQQLDFKPENVAAVTTWLASPLAEGVSGQLLGVAGSTATVWTNREQVNPTVAPEGLWTVERIAEARDQLFRTRSSDVPEYGDSM